MSFIMSHLLCFLKEDVSLARNSQGRIVILKSGDSVREILQRMLGDQTGAKS